MPTEPPPTDAEVIALSLADPQAFTVIFERHFDAVHRYAQRRIGRDGADEVAAETFARAFAIRRRYDRGQPIAKPWLLGIATKLMLRHWADERRRLTTRFDIAAGAGTPIDDSLAADLSTALAELTEEDRETLLLLAWADLSYEQIAAALQIPVGTVRSRLFRARRQLRERLQLDDEPLPVRSANV